ncbi:MAG: response regulator transcription factor [Chloroflexota bacterium]
MLKLIICDDQDVVRKGLNTIFQYEEAIEVVALAENGEEAVKLAAQHKPDVVLMDLKMPVLNGIHATRKIRTALSNTKVIVLTTYDSDDWVFDAIRAGASGYLLKDAESEEIVTAVKEAHQGRTYLDPNIAGKVLKAFSQLDKTPIKRNSDDPILERLTEREMSILRLMAQGKPNQEIAGELFLAPGTVKNNVSQILSKLHANDRTQAVLTALKRGIVDLE